MDDQTMSAKLDKLEADVEDIKRMVAEIYNIFYGKVAKTPSKSNQDKQYQKELKIARRKAIWLRPKKSRKAE